LIINRSESARFERQLRNDEKSVSSYRYL